MKLALARAMLQRADILLLDEPTNHLDVINVAWVKVRLYCMYLTPSCTHVYLFHSFYTVHLKPSFCTIRVQLTPSAYNAMPIKTHQFTPIKPPLYIQHLWNPLKAYINSLKDVTAIMVSHDSGFLNDWYCCICTIYTIYANIYTIYCILYTCTIYCILYVLYVVYVLCICTIYMYYMYYMY
jgi:hypothetical protein